MNSTALELAAWAHRGQKRYREEFTVLTGSGLKKAEEKAEPFILHPMRVALNVRRAAATLGSPELVDAGFLDHHERRMQQVALLHDVIEDTKLKADDLVAAGFEEGVITDVETLTRDPEDSYAEYIGKVDYKGTLTAIAVKTADLLDNLDGYTLDGVFADVSLVKRYRKALAQLGWTGREAL
jgi:(p)ppGpp synthase/HD superfamily hydrolase|tara:strand:+ start:274 stop:819 length:546 start_codon:yes stop_codon:yes gene_type:complete